MRKPFMAKAVECVICSTEFPFGDYLDDNNVCGAEHCRASYYNNDPTVLRIIMELVRGPGHVFSDVCYFEKANDRDKYRHVEKIIEVYEEIKQQKELENAS